MKYPCHIPEQSAKNSPFHHKTQVRGGSRKGNSRIRIVTALALFCGLSTSFGAAWSFGVIGDTQWTVPDDGQNANTVAAGIIRQINREFIAKGVSLVIAIGDNVHEPSKTSLDTHALYMQDLYNAGIAFYPMRGNHEAQLVDSGVELARIFPQIGTGVNNNTPKDIVAADLIPAADMEANPPAARKGEPFTLGGNFSAPATNAVHKSVSYSFDYNNVRFVLLDEFNNTRNTEKSTVAEQQEWISSRLADSQRPQHAFVFGHKPMRENLDPGSNLFGSLRPPNTDAAWDPARDAFIASLAQNRVHYYICGHEHQHVESVVTSSDGASSVRQLIVSPGSNLCFGKKLVSSEHHKAVSFFPNAIGFSICTVDGARVTIDSYAVDISALQKNCRLSATPQLTGQWKKIGTSNYTLGEAEGGNR